MISQTIFDEITISKLDAYIINYSIGSYGMQIYEGEELLTVLMQERMKNDNVSYETHVNGSRTDIYNNWKQSASADLAHLTSIANNTINPGSQSYNIHLNTLALTRKRLRLPA